jgi:hypothetical protein
MSETNNKIETNIAKIFCKLIDSVNNIVPIQKFDSVNCFYRWVDSYANDYVQSDYYNGSEDDLINIFIEIENLSDTRHCFNGNFVSKRLNFLANEGLQIVEHKNIKPNSFKVSVKEANDLIVNLAKKTKKTNNTKKKSVKRLRRDNKGRFIKNK